jgi:hypothetical protein
VLSKVTETPRARASAVARRRLDLAFSPKPAG